MVRGCFLSVGAQTDIIKLAVAGITIGGTNFFHCWVTDSV